MNCPTSPTGEHQYLPNEYSRDDMGFYLDCTHCGKTAFFDCDTEHDLYDLFEMNDDYDDD